jgi:diacylglycerol kinase (ATP)
MILVSRVFVLTNPAAGRGRRAARLARFRELLRDRVGSFDEFTTDGPGQEPDVIDRALADGYDTIVAIGGDGTWSLVADRIVRSGRRDVALGLLPAGTGNDFGKSFDITWERADAIVEAIASRRTKRIDVGRVGDRYFLNVVGLGFDIAVIDDSHRTRWLKGDALYRFCALRQLFRFPGVHLTVRGDAEETPERVDHLMLVVANGRYFGGSFDIAPDADLTDGRVHVVSIRNAPPLARLRLFDLVGKGRHEASDRVEVRRGSHFAIDFEAPLRYEVDGEVYETSEGRLVVESVPAALELIVPEREAGT